MFTGLIEEIGEVAKIAVIPGGKRITVRCSEILNDIKTDNSISVNGVCLTVIEFDKNTFTVETVGDTLKKSTMDSITVSTPVNLERALRLSDRLGGHLVQGHVNGVGKIASINQLGDNYEITIETPEFLSKYFIREGSVAVDGISLTIASINDSNIHLSIIPYTWNNTNLKYKNAGDRVNIEVDMIAKYVEKFLNLEENKSGLTIEKIRNAGF